MMNSTDNSVYDAIRTLAYEKAGMAMGEGKQALVQARIGKRLRALSLESPKEYLAYLKADTSGEELVQLLDALSTNHTAFFREPRHFDIMTEIVKDWKTAGMHSMKLWCAAASTGEEPYTHSMVLQEALGATFDLKILSTDISTRVLTACKTGVYSGERVGAIPSALRQKWFVKRGEDAWEVSEGLRRPMSFARLNLAEAPYPMKGPFDIIFCRNVMIYFDAAGRQKFVDQADRLLKPGGYLFVGTSESLSGIRTQFKGIHPSVYKKESA